MKSPSCPRNPFHFGRWRKLLGEMRPVPPIEGVTKGHVVTEGMFQGKYYRSKAPLTLARVRFLEVQAG